MAKEPPVSGRAVVLLARWYVFFMPVQTTLRPSSWPRISRLPTIHMRVCRSIDTSSSIYIRTHYI